MKRRLLFVVNNPAFFLSHRLAPALAARAAGYDVHVATMDGAAVAQVRALGFTHHAVPMTRSGRNPLHELRTLWALFGLFRQLRPHLVHLVTIKPVLYGGVAARIAGVPAMVAAISGLGFVFLSKTWRMRMLRKALIPLYRLALGHRNSRVIFQNNGDRDIMLALGAVRERQVVMMRGSGVDMAACAVLPEPAEPVVVAMAARLLADKGVREFVGAAQLLRARGAAVRMLLAGSPDPGNPASIAQAEMDAWRQDGAVTVLGECQDVPALYARSHIVALPSYREGLPKSLMEAAACARAVITTDVPGCRDAMEPGVSGVLVPVRDARALADAIAGLAGNAGMRASMGAAGRRLAERDFDVQVIAAEHVAVYNALL
jgi:glycosyltransferase involved in cell wall biosynthesis